jgi:hypothetical protein
MFNNYDSANCTPSSSPILDTTLDDRARLLVAVLVACGGTADYVALDRAGFRGTTLQRACRALESRGLAERVRQSNGSWQVRLVTADHPEERSKKNKASPVNDEHSLVNTKTDKCAALPSDTPLVCDLCQIGMWRSVALKIAVDYKETLVRTWIEQAQLWGPEISNPGAWVRCALEGNWTPPCPVVADLSPDEVAERIAAAAWYGSTAESQSQILHQAKAFNSDFCKRSRELIGFLPNHKQVFNEHIGIDYLMYHSFNFSTRSHTSDH